MVMDMTSIVDVIKAVDKIIKIIMLDDDRLTLDDIKELEHYRYLLNYGDADE